MFNRGKDIAVIALSTALIIVGAFIKIQLPLEMYLTFQLFFVVLSGFLIGRKSAFAALSYMLLGLIGIPVFAAGGGFSYIFKPSFGYILAFIPAGYVVGLMTKNPDTSLMRYIIAGIIGILIIYVIGIIYLIFMVTFYMGSTVTAKYVFITLFLTTIWKDILLTVFAAVIAKRIRPLVR